MRRLALLISFGALLAASALAARADQTGPRDQIFQCGEDHKLEQPIQLTWGNVVLAGDGRFFVPCPQIAGAAMPTNHTPDHRERREARLISEALGESAQGGVAGKPLSGQAPPEDLRLHAVRAYIRAGDGVKEQLPMFLKVGQVSIGVPDPLGMFMPSNVNLITPACNPIVFIASDPENGTRRWQSGRMFFLATDKSTAVRREAAYGIGVYLATRLKLDEHVVEAAWLELKACVEREKLAGVAGGFLQSIGAPRYPARLLDEVDAYLTEQSRFEPSIRILGAVTAIESLTRQHPNQKWSEALRVRLRQLVLYGARTVKGESPEVRIRRLALMALRNARDFDVPTLRAAVSDIDFQVRRLVAMSLNLSDPQQAPLGETLSNDFELQVRYEFLAPLQRLAGRTGLCAPMVKFFKDTSPAVVMRAMDLVPATCTDLQEVLPIIDGHAEKLNTGDSFKQWHVPSRALSALARLNPARAKLLFPAAVAHPVWQVRAAAAATAVTLEDAAAAEELAKDVEPNVRTAALDALFRLKSPALAEAAIDALKTQRDYQLLRAAALNLRGVADDLKLRATDAMLSALAMLTAEESDTSRDTREAIIDRLVETLPPERAGDLLPYVIDYDDTVVGAAMRAFEKIVGTSPGDRAKRRRYPHQPQEGVLYAPPEKAIMTFEEGTVIINFLPSVAPVTVARVHALIQQGYYNDKTFHRVVPNFVVQGGSPGKNEYAGVSRFMRDEVGPSAAHGRGTLGISTRGRDTGDAQIFVNLVDNPRLDMHYTVFAVVESGMEVIDKLLEGAVIRTFTIIK